MDKIEYVQIPKTVFEAMKVVDDYILTEREVAVINIHKKLFSKTIRQKALSLQFSIGEGKIKDIPTMLGVIEQLENVAKEYENISEVFEKQQAVEKEKEEEAKEEQNE